MNTAIFSALVGVAASSALKVHSTLAIGSEHMLRTLRGWAVAAFLISVGLEFLRRKAAVPRDSQSLQLRSALSALSLLSLLIAMLIAVRNSTSSVWVANALTLVGGGLAPTLILMGLEFPELRPRTAAMAAIMAVCLASVAGFNTLIGAHVPNPGTIRVQQPVEHGVSPRHAGAYAL